MQLLMSVEKPASVHCDQRVHVEIAATAHGYMINDGNIDYLYMFY